MWCFFVFLLVSLNTTDTVTGKMWIEYHYSVMKSRIDNLWQGSLHRFLYRDTTALVGHGLFIVEDSRSHSETPHWIGLPWTSVQPDAETSTWHHTTLTRVLGGIRTHNPSMRVAADPRIRPRSQWNRPMSRFTKENFIVTTTVVSQSEACYHH